MRQLHEHKHEYLEANGIECLTRQISAVRAKSLAQNSPISQSLDIASTPPRGKIVPPFTSTEMLECFYKRLHNKVARNLDSQCPNNPFPYRFHLRVFQSLQKHGDSTQIFLARKPFGAETAFWSARVFCYSVRIAVVDGVIRAIQVDIRMSARCINRVSLEPSACAQVVLPCAHMVQTRRRDIDIFVFIRLPVHCVSYTYLITQSPPVKLKH